MAIATATTGVTALSSSDGEGGDEAPDGEGGEWTIGDEVEHVDEDVRAAGEVLGGGADPNESVTIADLLFVRAETARPMWVVYVPDHETNEWVPHDYINPYALTTAVDLAHNCRKVSRRVRDGAEDDDNDGLANGGMFA